MSEDSCIAILPYYGCFLVAWCDFSWVSGCMSDDGIEPRYQSCAIEILADHSLAFDKPVIHDEYHDAVRDAESRKLKMFAEARILQQAVLEYGVCDFTNIEDPPVLTHAQMAHEAKKRKEKNRNRKRLSRV